MNNKDLYIDYTINWQQEYLNWDEFVVAMDECMLQSSEMKDAIKVIDKIKNLK